MRMYLIGLSFITDSVFSCIVTSSIKYQLNQRPVRDRHRQTWLAEQRSSMSSGEGMDSLLHVWVVNITVQKSYRHMGKYQLYALLPPEVMPPTSARAAYAR
jgi:hypothetical protein